MLAEPKLADAIWPKVWPLIESAVRLETADDILADLKAARRFLLVVGDGVAVVRPCEGFLEINYVGGKSPRNWWGQMSEAIDLVAKSLNLPKIVAFGRDSWKKLAPDYEPTGTRMFVKEVAHG